MDKNEATALAYNMMQISSIIAHNIETRDDMYALQFIDTLQHQIDKVRYYCFGITDPNERSIDNMIVSKEEVEKFLKHNDNL